MRFTLLLAALLVVSGCMLNPVDGQLVSSTTSSLPFSGFSNTASQTVELQYASGVGSTVSWNTLSTTTTSPTVTTTMADGTQLYGWNLSGVIPPSSWLSGTTGSFARVRMRVPNGGVSGEEAFMYTFKPTWSECYGRNPSLGNFISRCKSPNAPVAYLYTNDYPTGADFAVTTMLWSSTGRTEVRVRNQGRHGRLMSVTCSRIGQHTVFTVDEPLAPGETKVVMAAVTPAGSVTCTATGTNEDGSAEANTANNTMTRSF